MNRAEIDRIEADARFGEPWTYNGENIVDIWIDSHDFYALLAAARTLADLQAAP